MVDRRKSDQPPTGGPLAGDDPSAASYGMIHDLNGFYQIFESRGLFEVICRTCFKTDIAHTPAVVTGENKERSKLQGHMTSEGTDAVDESIDKFSVGDDDIRHIFFTETRDYLLAGTYHFKLNGKLAHINCQSKQLYIIRIMISK